MTQDTAQGGQAAANAAFTLNGIAATSTTNTVSNALDGVTLKLLKTSAIATAATEETPATYTSTTLTVSKSTTNSLSTSLTSFVKAYNEASKLINDLGAYNAETKTAGAMQGDATLRTAKTQLSRLFFGATAGGTSVYQHLSNIGVSLGKDGLLTVDSTKLSAAATADAAAVANLVAAAGTAFKTGLEGFVGTSGSIVAATDSANQSIKNLTKQQEALSERLTAIQERYTKEFTTLDTLVAKMKSTSTYLTQQLANLPSFNSSNN